MIIEDGTQVTNSNSYSTRAEYIAYALSIGIAIADTDAADNELVKAAEYIGSFEQNLKGTIVARDQSMAYPRTDLEINGWHWSSTEIPKQVKDCQMMYALDINGGEDLFNRSVNPQTAIKKEKVDIVEVEYQHNGNIAQTLNKTSKGDSLIDILLRSNSMSFTLVRS